MHLKRLHLGRIASTNDYLSKLQKEGKARDATVLVADYQETGKGQGAHSWQSNPGENLLMSLLIFPAFLSASDQFQLSKLASLALCDTLQALKLNPEIKWPNDILVNRRKIAGILIENGITGNRLSHTIIGIGLNLGQDDFPEFPVPATSLVMEGLPAMTPTVAADLLIPALLHRHDQLKSGSEMILEMDYLDRFFGLDTPCEFITGGVKISGIIRGVGGFGELLVEREGSITKYNFHEIKCIVPA